MSLLFRRSEARASSGGGGWADAWARGDGSLGSSMEASLRLGPVYSAVSLLADAVASLPCKVYRNRAGGREAVPNQPMLVTDPGVAQVNRVTWRHQAMVSLLLRGNAFGVIVAWDSQNVPAKIQWLNPDWVEINPNTGPNPRYYYLGREIPRETVVHIPAFTLPGSVAGLAPLTLFRLQIEGGLNAVKFSRDWWRNPQPPGIVRNEAKVLDRTEAQAAKASYMASLNAGEPWFTGKDWNYTALTATAADERFVEQIKATATQVAAIYHVAPEDIGGETGSSLTYSTVELNGLRFAQRGVMPWTVRFEAALDRLLPRGQYMKHNLDSLARADLRSRMAAHQIALVNGIETNSEARALEDRPPLTDEEKAEWQALYGHRGPVPDNPASQEGTR